MIWFLVICLPLLAAILTPLMPMGRRGWAGLVFAGTVLPALWLGLVEVPGVTAHWLILETHFALDGPRQVILLLTAVLWGTAGLFAASTLRDDARGGEFFFYFGMSMAGNFGLLIAAEVASFYTFFALMTFASYGLVIYSRTPFARRAARIYLVMAVIGELFLLTAFYMAVRSAGSMLLADLAPALAQDPQGPLIFVLGLVGFGVKAGIIPLYFWLPLAHPAAPAPASAVLSGAMIKAGLVGWMHLAPVGLVQWPSLSLAMVSLGFAAAIGAALYGLTQVDAKTNLAYSSISQMGVMTLLLGIGLHGGIPPELLFPAIALYAYNHGTAKALLFMGTALPAKVGGTWRILMWAGLGLGVLAIAGGPLTGGLWTKYLVKTFLGQTTLPGGQTFLYLLTLSAVTTTLLLSRFLHLLHRTQAPAARQAPALLLPWLLLLVAGGWWTMSPMLLPPGLQSHVAKDNGMVAFFLDRLTNWSSLWPIGVGVILMALSLRVAFFNWWPVKKPALPPGDLLHLILPAGGPLQQGLGKAIAGLQGFMQRLYSPERLFYKLLDAKRTSRISARAETLLRRWEVVGIAFLLFFLTLFYFLP